MRDIRDEARNRWPSIFSQLGIDVGAGEHKPCPVCGGDDRFRFDDQEGSGSWFCNVCDPQAGYGIDLVQRYFTISFKDACAKVREVLGEAVVCQPKDRCGDVSKNKRMIIELWKSSYPITETTPAGEYLKNRGFKFKPDDSVLRYCPKCYERETGNEIDAMIAVVKNGEGKTVSLHRTYLEKVDGRWWKASIEKPKKFMPCVLPMKGSAIRLLPANGKVGIAEGIETALACSKKFRVPTWAACSSTIMQSFDPPKGTKEVWIFGDNDENNAGQRAVGALSHKLVESGHRVKIEISPTVGSDWWDVVMGDA